MAEPTVLGTIQIQALPVADKPDGTELLHVKQGTADKRTTIAEAVAVHGDLQNNPHGVDNTQVGLGNVTNDAQLKIASNLDDVADKPTARNNLDVYSKAETDAKFTPQIRRINGHTLESDVTITAEDVGLGNVPNYPKSDDFREDADKLSTARAVSALFRAIQDETPPGTIIHTYDARNPGTYKLCGGVWQLIGKGRTLVGYDDTVPARPVGTEFGAKQAQLIEGNLPPHKHGVNITSGSHTHRVTGKVAAGGSHGHSGSGTTSGFDYGSKTTSGFDHGTKTTNTTGEHTHFTQFRTALASPEGSGDWEAVGPGTGRNLTTSTAGNHSHTVFIGEHSHTVFIGSHSHTFSFNTSTTPAHQHDVDITSQASGLNIVGDTGMTGSATPFSIEQPSLVCYIWRRMS